MRIAAVAVLLFASPALADPTVAIVAGAPITHTRKDGADVTRDAQFEPSAISFADCEEDVTVNVPLTLGGDFTNAKLEAWVGAGCDVDATRATACWRVNAQPITPSPSYTAAIRAQDIVSQAGAPQKNGYVAGTEEACRTQQTSPGAIDATLYFLWETNDGKAIANAFAKTPTPIDLRAAAPPAWKDVGSGDGMLTFSWTPLGDNDTLLYRVFLAPRRGQEPATPPDAASCPDPFPATPDGGSPPLDASDAFDHVDFQGSNTAGGVISDLVDENTYSLAVAAVDKVGNVGPLSDVKCEAPHAVADFWDKYRAAGGGAGGSCAVGPTSAVPPLLVLVVVAALAARRHRPN